MRACAVRNSVGVWVDFDAPERVHEKGSIVLAIVRCVTRAYNATNKPTRRDERPSLHTHTQYTFVGNSIVIEGC